MNVLRELILSLWLANAPAAAAPAAATPPVAPKPPVAPTVPPPVDPSAPHVAQDPIVPKAPVNAPVKAAENAATKDAKAPAAKADEKKPAAEDEPSAKDKKRSSRSSKKDKAARDEERPSGAPSEETPPSINAGAFHGEVSKKKASAKEKESASAEPKSERARLEELAAEIAKAREALREDTAKLQATLKEHPKAGAAGVGDDKLPIGGDPLRPNAGGPPKEGYKGQVDTVSRAMKGMKPEQAAAIIARLDRPLAAEILRRMPAAEAGGVLGQLKPDLAADLATEIATRPSVVPKESKAESK